MTERRKLPARRHSDVVNFYHVHANGNKTPHVATLGFYEDGTIGEIFIDAHKQATGVAEQARDAAVLLSIALQYGVPMKEMHSAVGRDEDGRPHTIIGSALDVLVKELGK